MHSELHSADCLETDNVVRGIHLTLPEDTLVQWLCSHAYCGAHDCNVQKNDKLVSTWRLLMPAETLYAWTFTCMYTTTHPHGDLSEVRCSRYT